MKQPLNDMKKILTLSLLLSLTSCFEASSESGYEAWLRYTPVEDPVKLREYQSLSGSVFVFGNSEILNSALGELKYGIKGMTGSEPVTTGKLRAGNIIIGKITDIPDNILRIPDDQLSKLTQEGYLIFRKGKRIVITGKSDAGLLYGVFRLLRLMQMGESLADLNILENPRTRLRLLNHWDNPGKVPDGIPSIERGYSGESIFRWDELPHLNRRYTDYARMLASVGINGTVINNVNTAKNGLEGWKLLTPEYFTQTESSGLRIQEIWCEALYLGKFLQSGDDIRA